MALGSTKLLTEINTRCLLRGKGRPTHKANTLTAICGPAAYKMWALQPYGLPRPITGLTSLFFLTSIFHHVLQLHLSPD
jgi:hypothetical protein